MVVIYIWKLCKATLWRLMISIDQGVDLCCARGTGPSPPNHQSVMMFLSVYLDVETLFTYRFSTTVELGFVLALAAWSRD